MTTEYKVLISPRDMEVLGKEIAAESVEKELDYLDTHPSNKWYSEVRHRAILALPGKSTAAVEFAIMIDKKFRQAKVMMGEEAGRLTTGTGQRYNLSNERWQQIADKIGEN